jgi:hypothetical protein
MKILPLLLLLSQNKTTSGFAAGDLADPHGTHEVCLNTILAAMKQLKSQSYMHDCWLWLYRGAWYEGTSRNRYGSAFKSKRSTIEKKRYFFTISLKRTE